MKNKEKIKEIILKTLQALALFGLFAFSYSGLIYICKGNTLYSAMIALLMVLILGVLIYALIFQRTKKINIGFTIKEGGLIALYCIVAFVSFVFVAHYLNVEESARRDIVDSGTKKLDELSEMLKVYDKDIEAQFNTKKREIEVCISAYDSGSGQDINELRNCLSKYEIKSQRIRSKAAAKSEINSLYTTNMERAKRGYKELVEGSNVFIDEANMILRSWDETQLHNIFSKIQIQLQDTYDALDAMHSKGASTYWKLDQFNFSISEKNDDVISSPALLNKQYNPSRIGAFLICLLLHSLILLPYFLTSRGLIKYPRPLNSKYKPGQPI